VVGGNILRDNPVKLRPLGVAEVFGPGAASGEIVDFPRGAVAV